MNKLIKWDECIVNNTYVKMLEAPGYDIELHYVKSEEWFVSTVLSQNVISRNMD